MAKVTLKYIGAISEIAVKGFGIVKYGDTILVDEEIASTFSNESWEKPNMLGFDKKLNKFNKGKN